MNRDIDKEIPKMDPQHMQLFKQLREYERKEGWKTLFFILLQYYRHYHYKEGGKNAYGFTRDEHNLMWMKPAGNENNHPTGQTNQP